MENVLVLKVENMNILGKWKVSAFLNVKTDEDTDDLLEELSGSVFGLPEDEDFSLLFDSFFEFKSDNSVRSLLTLSSAEMEYEARKVGYEIEDGCICVDKKVWHETDGVIYVMSEDEANYKDPVSVVNDDRVILNGLVLDRVL